MKHRGNHENQKDFINRSTMFFLSNDIPAITPIDGSIIERAKFIRFKKKKIIMHHNHVFEPYPIFSGHLWQDSL